MDAGNAQAALHLRQHAPADLFAAALIAALDEHPRAAEELEEAVQNSF